MTSTRKLKQSGGYDINKIFGEMPLSELLNFDLNNVVEALDNNVIGRLKLDLAIYDKFQHQATLGKGAFGSAQLMKANEQMNLTNGLVINQGQLVVFKSLSILEKKKKILDELSIHAQISLTNCGLPKLFGYFEAPDQYVIVMEYVQGKSLSDTIKANIQTLDINNANHMLMIRDLITKLEKTIECLHSNDITHNDIHLGNVMVNPGATFDTLFDNPVLIDYGFSCKNLAFCWLKEANYAATSPNALRSRILYADSNITQLEHDVLEKRVKVLNKRLKLSDYYALGIMILDILVLIKTKKFDYLASIAIGKELIKDNKFNVGAKTVDIINSTLSNDKLALPVITKAYELIAKSVPLINIGQHKLVIPSTQTETETDPSGAQSAYGSISAESQSVYHTTLINNQPNETQSTYQTVLNNNEPKEIQSTYHAVSNNNQPTKIDSTYHTPQNNYQPSGIQSTYHTPQNNYQPNETQSIYHDVSNSNQPNEFRSVYYGGRYEISQPYF